MPDPAIRNTKCLITMTVDVRVTNGGKQKAGTMLIMGIDMFSTKIPWGPFY